MNGFVLRLCDAANAIASFRFQCRLSDIVRRQIACTKLWVTVYHATKAFYHDNTQHKYFTAVSRKVILEQQRVTAVTVTLVQYRSYHVLHEPCRIESMY